MTSIVTNSIFVLSFLKQRSEHMNETSDKLRIFIINMAAQSLGELQESEIISKVNDAVENMLDLFFVGKAT